MAASKCVFQRAGTNIINDHFIIFVRKHRLLVNNIFYSLVVKYLQHKSEHARRLSSLSFLQMRNLFTPFGIIVQRANWISELFSWIFKNIRIKHIKQPPLSLISFEEKLPFDSSSFYAYVKSNDKIMNHFTTSPRAFSVKIENITTLERVSKSNVETSRVALKLINFGIAKAFVCALTWRKISQGYYVNIASSSSPLRVNRVTSSFFLGNL